MVLNKPNTGVTQHRCHIPEGLSGAEGTTERLTRGIRFGLQGGVETTAAIGYALCHLPIPRARKWRKRQSKTRHTGVSSGTRDRPLPALLAVAILQASAGVPSCPRKL